MNSEAPGSGDDMLVTFCEALRVELVDALPAWIRAAVDNRLGGADRDPTIDDEVDHVTSAVVASVDGRMRTLAAADVDEPLSGPLEIVRQSIGPLTDLLARLGLEEPARDAFDRAARPDDRFDLGPMSFLELGPGVHEAGIAWGAAKAFVHRSRRVVPPSDRG